jgi:hypothetical protein
MAITVAPQERCLTDAAEELGVDYRTLRKEAPNLASRIEETARGPRFWFDDDAIARVPRCSCGEIAPTGHCRRHQALKYEPEQRTCARPGCDRTRLVYGSSIRGGRGRYCSRRCNMLAQRAAQPTKFHHPDGAKLRERAIREELDLLEADGWYHGQAAADRAGSKNRASLALMYGSRGKLYRIKGCRRLLYHEDVLDEIRRTRPSADWSGFRRGWFQGLNPGGRARWLEKVTGNTKWWGPLGGRPRATTDDEERKVRELLAAGTSQRAVARIARVTYKQVRRIATETAP